MVTDPKILVVDDVAMFRELMASFLAPSGRVIRAATGEEALERVEREQPDLVVADLCLPGIDGDELCRRIKALPDGAETPVVLVTASGREADHARAVRSGAEDVLSKPLYRDTLIASASRFLRGDAPVGLPRSELAAPVRLWAEGEEARGVARNVSRGGMFIEAPLRPPLHSELRLEFQLPRQEQPLRPTAQVVWYRSPWRGDCGGIGVRFVGLDREAAQQLNDYVHENGAEALLPEEPQPARAGARR